MHPSHLGSPTAAPLIRGNCSGPSTPTRNHAAWTPVAARGRAWPLTPRETDVLAAMAAGKTNAAIAEALYISRKAVEKHVNAIFSKLLLCRDDQHPRVQSVLIYLARMQATETTTEPVALTAGHPSGPRRHAHYAPTSRRHCRP